MGSGESGTRKLLVARERGIPMTVTTRREWLHAAVATAGGAVLATANPRTADAGQTKTPAAPKPGYPNRRAGNIEILFKAPGQSANGMAGGQSLSARHVGVEGLHLLDR